VRVSKNEETGTEASVADEIDAILNAYHSNTLWQMANAAGLEVTRGGKRLSKAQVSSKLRAEFFTLERVKASWERLSQREQAVLNRLLLRGGKAPTRNFRREIVRAGLATLAGELGDPNRYYYGVSYAQGYAGDPGRTRSTIFEDVIARLAYHGLVFSQDAPFTSGGTPYKLQFHPAAILYIPQVVQRYLPEPVPLDTIDLRPDRVQTGEPASLLRDLYLYWDFVRRNEVTLNQSGLVGKRWLKAINEILLVPDPELEDARREDKTGRLFMLHQFLAALKLIETEQGQLRPVGPDALHIPPFWSRTPDEQARMCLEAWPQLSGSNDLGTAAAA
jgi:hypothetical protein